jgi:hypothetical protein
MTTSIHEKKKVLCLNIVKNNYCNYGDKCVYAHTLKEQNINPLRKKIYTIMRNGIKIPKLDLIDEPDFYATIKELTKTCIYCEKYNCVGGYNCKNGAITTYYTICDSDLMKGVCHNTECEKYHLTNLGLIPYIIQQRNLSPRSDMITHKIKNLDFATKIFMNGPLRDLSDTDSEDYLLNLDSDSTESDQSIFD